MGLVAMLPSYAKKLPESNEKNLRKTMGGVLAELHYCAKMAAKKMIIKPEGCGMWRAHIVPFSLTDPILEGVVGRPMLSSSY